MMKKISVNARNLKLSYVLCIMFLIGNLGITRDSNAMAGLFGEYVLFSAVSGRVLNGEQPVADATITQSVTISGSDTTLQTTQSKSDGTFSFPQISRKKGLLSLLPAQFTAGQSMTISVNGTEYEGWLYTKFSDEADSENEGKPLKMICDIAQNPEKNGESYGICKLTH